MSSSSAHLEQRESFSGPDQFLERAHTKLNLDAEYYGGSHLHKRFSSDFESKYHQSAILHVNANGR